MGQYNLGLRLTVYRSKKEGTGISNSLRPHFCVLTAISEAFACPVLFSKLKREVTKRVIISIANVHTEGNLTVHLCTVRLTSSGEQQWGTLVLRKCSFRSRSCR